MKDEWVFRSLALARKEATFYSGCRKILTNQHFTFTGIISDDLVMADAGFTKSKMSMLVRNYLNQASMDAAVELWQARVKKNKYGSVGVSTYNHFKKGNIDGSSPRGSVMGPCIQSMVLTYVKRGEVVADLFYRTTELFKKFPADLVFIRDILLPPFEVTPTRINFHFANVTCHPMYFVTLIPHIDDPIEFLGDLRSRDPFFHDWVVKWTARYLCPKYERGIAKFAQALRVQMDARQRISKKLMPKLQRYLTDNHPGYRNDPKDEEDENE